MHGQVGRSRLARATASPMWSKWPWVTSIRSQRSIESCGARTPSDCRTTDRSGSTLLARRPDLEAGVAVPGERRVADRDPSGHLRVDATTRLHSGRARHADRPEPRIRQLDRPDRPRARLLRRGRPAPAADDGHARLPALHDALRPRVRCPRRGSPTGPCRTSLGTRRSSSIRPGTRRDRAALLLFCVLLAAASLVARRRRSATSPSVVEWAALAAAIATLLFGALAWGDGSLGAAALLVQLAVVSAAIGGVFAAMILGHWYLVTPEAPRGAAHPARPRPARRGRRPGRAVRGRGSGPAPARPTSRRSPRSSGRGPCSSGCA